MCKRDFCDECSARPYHRGWTCQQFRQPDCRFCSTKVLEHPLMKLAPGALASTQSQGPSLSARQS